MKRQFLKEALGFGFLLWLIGFGLGVALFSFVPPSVIGWIIMPIGIALTLWFLFKLVKGKSLQHYLVLAIFWTLIAVVFDYIFLGKALKPADRYYKLDVYLYYALTFLLPLGVGWYKTRSTNAAK